MLSYFIPISLLVLAGFTLGLLVGRVAWGSPKAIDQIPAKPVVPNERQHKDVVSERADVVSGRPATKRSGQELPVWQMKTLPAEKDANGHR